MQDELSLEASGLATVRLMNGTWASYLQRGFDEFKRTGARHRADGSKYLVQRMKMTRPTTYSHCVRVARLAHATGRVLGFSDVQLKQLGRAAMLHDIGKIFVPENVLNRPRKPNRVEYFVLRLHPTFGAILVSYFGLPAALRIRTQHHHERWDGKGYPHKLSGEEIPQMARVLQVADTYDAMTDDRPYRKPATHDEAIAELLRCSGNQFDPRMVTAFLDAINARTLSTQARMRAATN